MYIGHDTFLLESRFSRTAICLPPDKKKFCSRAFHFARKWILNIELFGKLDIEIQEKLESNTNL